MFPRALGWLTLVCAASGAWALPIARHGEARVMLRIAEGAIAPERTAAAELVGYLTRITGAEFRIDIGDGMDIVKIDVGALNGQRVGTLDGVARV